MPAWAWTPIREGRQEKTEDLSPLSGESRARYVEAWEVAHAEQVGDWNRPDSVLRGNGSTARRFHRQGEPRRPAARGRPGGRRAPSRIVP
jgi:hypothetical protein